MTRTILTRAGAALFCSSALLNPALAPLHAQSAKGGVDISLTAEGVSNPILDQVDTDMVPAGTVEIRPWLRSETATSTFDLQAFANLREFASDYQTEDRYGGTAKISSQVSERVRIRVDAGVYSSNGRLGSLVSGGVPIADPDALPGIPIDPALADDITVLGQNGRTTTWSVGAGLEAQVSERDLVTFDAGFQDLSLSNRLRGQEYKTADANLSWQNRIAERTSVGVFGGIRKTNYDNSLNGDATTLTGGVMLTQDIGEDASLEIGVGLADTDIEQTPLTPGRNLTTFAAQAALCQRGQRRSLCVSYRRTPVPTSLGGVRNSDALNLSLSEQISEKNRVTLGGSFSRTDEGAQGPVATPEIKFADIRGSINRAFTQRVEGFIFAGVSRLYRDDIATDASISFGIGINIRLGDRR